MSETPLSQAMLLDGMYPGIVEKWAARALALEAELADYKQAAEDIALWGDFNTLRAELALLRSQYYELLYQVATKHENETRHETALRYIRERENRTSGPAMMELIIKEQGV